MNKTTEKFFKEHGVTPKNFPSLIGGKVIYYKDGQERVPNSASFRRMVNADGDTHSFEYRELTKHWPSIETSLRFGSATTFYIRKLREIEEVINPFDEEPETPVLSIAEMYALSDKKREEAKVALRAEGAAKASTELEELKKQVEELKGTLKMESVAFDKLLENYSVVYNAKELAEYDLKDLQKANKSWADKVEQADSSSKKGQEMVRALYAMKHKYSWGYDLTDITRRILRADFVDILQKFA